MLVRPLAGPPSKLTVSPGYPAKGDVTKHLRPRWYRRLVVSGGLVERRSKNTWTWTAGRVGGWVGGVGVPESGRGRLQDLTKGDDFEIYIYIYIASDSSDNVWHTHCGTSGIIDLGFAHDQLK